MWLRRSWSPKHIPSPDDIVRGGLGTPFCFFHSMHSSCTCEVLYPERVIEMMIRTISYKTIRCRDCSAITACQRTTSFRIYQLFKLCIFISFPLITNWYKNNTWPLKLFVCDEFWKHRLAILPHDRWTWRTDWCFFVLIVSLSLFVTFHLENEWMILVMSGSLTNVRKQRFLFINPTGYFFFICGQRCAMLELDCLPSRFQVWRRN